MTEQDGITISDKPCWKESFRDLGIILVKRIIALPSKMIGFKPFCLYLATWLLVQDKISGWIWFAVLVVVLFGIIGLKVLAQVKQGGLEGGKTGWNRESDRGG
jgi:hypothetical protein